MTKLTFPPTGANFTIITPNAVSCGRVNQFVVIADSDNPYDVRWCAIGDPTDWPTPNTDDARSKQAGSQTMPNDLGVVTGIAGGDFLGYVLQERGVTKMTYVGGDVVFSFDTFEKGRGCWEYNRYELVDDTVFYESEFGYKALENGIIADIGHGFVDDTYPPRKLTEEQRNVVANKAITTVFFESQNLAFNWKTGQWTRLPAFDGASLFSIDDIDDIVGRSLVLTTGAAVVGQSSGTIQTATLTTGDSDINSGGRTFIRGVRPLNDGGTWTVRVGSRDDLSTTTSFSTSTSVTARTGYADFREEGRYQRVELTNSDGFTTLVGADIDFEPAGRV